tara:strand:+ start:2287 stop:3117 length:831 start_codon:yes stop_codon:yes gene_type:complete
MNGLIFGTGGIPLSTEPRDLHSGISQVNKLGLGVMELEFVHSVFIKKDKTEAVKEVAKKENVILTAHASYYINLSSEEKQKVGASRTRILQAAKIAYLSGGYSVCFHPGYYMKSTKLDAYNRFKKQMRPIMKELDDEGVKIWVRPETTGKVSQVGSFDECLKISEEFDRVLPCIDFAHLHARSNGEYNTKEEFREVMTKYEQTLGKKALQNMHIHMSGINYGEKGEKNHLPLKDSDMNYKDLMKVLKEFKCKGVVICESPILEKDALLMKKTYSSL